MNPNLPTINRTFLARSAAMLVACVLVVSNAVAEEPVRSETVKFQDLNVSSPAGAEALYNRIHSAAKRVCVQNDPVMQAAVLPCLRSAEARAIQLVNLPLLTDYYRKKTGQSPEAIVARR
jgi:UrcA family protein